jgi:hypothetical protein
MATRLGLRDSQDVPSNSPHFAPSLDRDGDGTVGESKLSGLARQVGDAYTFLSNVEREWHHPAERPSWPAPCSLWGQRALGIAQAGWSS